VWRLIAHKDCPFLQARKVICDFIANNLATRKVWYERDDSEVRSRLEYLPSSFSSLILASTYAGHSSRNPQNHASEYEGQFRCVHLPSGRQLVKVAYVVASYTRSCANLRLQRTGGLLTTSKPSRATSLILRQTPSSPRSASPFPLMMRFIP
jgi:hypothetical protein